LIVREAGKTLSNAIAEVREAVDFLRYYGLQARQHLDNATHPALGVAVCISPWNFPLAIFTGQLAAALAAGNAVIAKPAEQTPLIAAEAVRLLHAAGVPHEALQLLPGTGETVGAALVADARVAAVVFTGSTEVARIIQKTLAQRLDARGKPVTLIAETGGQNAMVVDSSALAEQVVGDILVSAFDSAGQRCSALRVLCVQEEVADRIVGMLKGAMQELRLGDPASLAVDVGPVIDDAARDGLQQHIDRMRAEGRPIVQAKRGEAPATGTFIPPTLIEIETLDELTREVFGPVLHVLRYRRDGLDTLVERIDALGYGLTLGVHSRVDEQIGAIVSRAHVGNVYVNRNIVGAVVGVQPFGGEGLSGTGPKAGGPLYLYRLLASCPPDVAREALQALDAHDHSSDFGSARPGLDALAALRQWADDSSLGKHCARLAELTPLGAAAVLPGPTGERNTYAVLPRERVLCLADDDRDRLAQLALVLAVGGKAVWPADLALRGRLPRRVREQLIEVRDWKSPEAFFDAVLHHGSREHRLDVQRRIAMREGPLVLVHAFEPGEDPLVVERLLVERVVSVNTAAAGGNASLMTVG
jgi:RHH-type proline utilization regulon transcriptional repressor/proline dehydrogenase/delta 1-pyrroline-5-carboxylate dehydrogenase